MLRRRLLIGLLPLVPLALSPLACGDTGVAHLGLVMSAPQGLLGSASSVTLRVFDAAGTKCDANGHVSAVPSGAGTKEFALEKSGCAAGVAWCKTIELDKDGSTKMFSVEAKGPAGILAEGCSVAAVDQDPLDVDISMKRYNPPPCCNDGMLQAGEQCEGNPAPVACDGSPGGTCLGIAADEVCGCNCVANEIALDRALNSVTPPAAGTKSSLAMTFSAGLDGALRAAFTDTSMSANGGSDVAVRAMKKDLFSEDKLPVLSGPLRIPLLCSSPKGPGVVRKQQHPSIAPLATNSVGVAYESDEINAARTDIFVSVQTDTGCADIPPFQVNKTTSGSATAPDIAGGPNASALVVWTTETKQILARIVTTSGATGQEIVIANNAGEAKVAGTSAGWIVVYAGAGGGDGDGILMRKVDMNGTAGTEALVNAATSGVQDEPDISALDDGSFAIVWRSGGDIFVQRFDPAATPVSSDQDNPINTTTDGDQASPVITAAVGVGDFYAVAWQDAASGSIRARFLGAIGGYRFNSVTGQNDDFDAANPFVAGERHAPAIAIGGGGFVAIGWQDDSADHPGVFVRRFPLPAE